MRGRFDRAPRAERCSRRGEGGGVRTPACRGPPSPRRCAPLRLRRVREASSLWVSQWGMRSRVVRSVVIAVHRVFAVPVIVVASAFYMPSCGTSPASGYSNASNASNAAAAPCSDMTPPAKTNGLPGCGSQPCRPCVDWCTYCGNGIDVVQCGTDGVWGSCPDAPECCGGSSASGSSGASTYLEADADSFDAEKSDGSIIDAKPGTDDPVGADGSISD
jgi:hypothetical protein